jgi:hypothetical protein
VLSDRPILFAMLSAAGALALTAGVLWWAQSDPEGVVIGMEGRHDAERAQSERLADCLDCHVPFVGTPGSRCLGPGCHGELATGTPPRDGPAMPIRFHAALRDEPCNTCHVEHTDQPRKARKFDHAMIPKKPRADCARCHSGAEVKSHARTDAIGCDVCHGLETFDDTEMDHKKVANHACDVCHAAPKNEVHATVAGACTDCHNSEGWGALDPW